MATKTIKVGKIYQLTYGTIPVFVLIVGKIKSYPCFQGGGDFKTLTPGSNQFKHRIMYYCDWKELTKEQ